MNYEATMIINGHQPVHIGYYPNKEKAAEAIIDHAKNNSAWIITHEETFARAWLDGYEIEKEKLYIVEIPNPNLNAHTVLQKTEKGIVLISVTNARWRGLESSKLTESEIKQDFEWAWQFAKEVERWSKH